MSKKTKAKREHIGVQVGAELNAWLTEQSAKQDRSKSSFIRQSLENLREQQIAQ